MGEEEKQRTFIFELNGPVNMQDVTLQERLETKETDKWNSVSITIMHCTYSPVL